MTSKEQRLHATMVVIQYILITLCVVATILLMWWLLKYSAYGIDFTDEGFYLTWVSNPFVYDWSITQFGFVYHPLYGLLDGNIAMLRRVNIAITFGLAWVLTGAHLSSLVQAPKLNSIVLLATSAGLATSAFILFNSWLLMPSYNSLVLQSLLVCATGLVLIDKKAHFISVIGWLLIGIGGWLAFMAKPSTALALAVGVLGYLVIARLLSFRMLALAVVCALALLSVSAILIDGSMVGFFRRLQLGIEFAGHLGGGHTLGQILRVDGFYFNEKSRVIFLLVFILLSVAFWGMFAEGRMWLFLSLSISVFFFSLTVLLVHGRIIQVAGLGRFQGLLTFSTVCAAAFVVLMRRGMTLFGSISARQWAMAALFLMMPHIYSFGTNNNYWRAGSSAAIFWLLSGVTLLVPLIRERASWVHVLLLAIASQAVTAALLQTGFENPYRQPQSLRLNSSILKIGPQGSPVVLSQGFADYIASAVLSSQKAGFTPNTPVIDLTGQSPGVLYAINAEGLGQAWNIGGYPGSLKLAESALALVPCEKISKAWILLEPDGPRSIPVELMFNLGADFPRNYELVGTWETADGAGGYPSRRIQELYKPVAPNHTLMACMKLREEDKKL